MLPASQSSFSSKVMDEFRITEEIYSQIKDFQHHYLTKEQQLLIDKCYGVTQNPSTKDYVMIMDYARKGSLRNFLNENYYDMKWEHKILYLNRIIDGLVEIHEQGIVHQDFHSGNILVKDEHNFCIGDLGLCKKLEEQSTKKDKINVFGVLPYIAPEVLNGQKYTRASDIYSYVPQLILDVIEQCWNGDPLKRPSTSEVEKIFQSFYVNYEPNSEIYKQYSLRIDFIKSKASENANNSFETGISESMQFDIIKSEELDNLDIYEAGIS
ncbi:9127_t:CDS:2, partial [Funneliformis geosporum]